MLLLLKLVIFPPFSLLKFPAFLELLKLVKVALLLLSNPSFKVPALLKLPMLPALLKLLMLLVLLKVLIIPVLLNVTLKPPSFLKLLMLLELVTWVEIFPAIVIYSLGLLSQHFR
ncbi:hypothetical protein CDV25_07970 [Helicobacter apodemus]|uniref:Uncharacterized protein n=1 Tax=Helicobacter apodemus TaxID=135569 RepID=A0A2U8FER3_9HELI|nr:hypothetical protein CDV25_07970 [Helicobacter apodemus]